VRHRLVSALRSQGEKKTVLIYSLACLSVFFFVLLRLFGERPPRVRQEMVEAAKLMKAATEEIVRCRESRGIPVDWETDPNGTGLIGVDYSPLTTSLGNLEAKRTTTNPNFAGLLVRLFWEAGAKKGDAVAIGASSSFPALILASLCAAQVMGLEALLISSLGASQWGANNPDFHWLDIQDCLNASGWLRIEPLAFSLGGEGDRAQDMTPEGKDFLVEEAKRRGIRLLQESTLSRIVGERIRLYQEASQEKGKSIKVFVNIGGSYANLGTDSRILDLKPGRAEFRDIPPSEKRGVLFEMAACGVPVIHLLYIKGLAERYGLPWDPKPLPEPGEGKIYTAGQLNRAWFFSLGIIYLVLTGFHFFIYRRW